MKALVHFSVILAQILFFPCAKGAEEAAATSRYFTRVVDGISLSNVLNTAHGDSIDVERLLMLVPPRYDECSLLVFTSDYLEIRKAP